MATDLLHPRDRLSFSAVFRSLMTACEVNGNADENGAAAFEARQEYMLPWVERHGIETARTIGLELGRLVRGLKRRAGTVWSDEFEFNHRWAASDAARFFEHWRSELTAAAESFEAQSIILLSLVRRVRDRQAELENNPTGNTFVTPITEREFAVLVPHFAIRDEDRWVYVDELERTEDGAPEAALCWPLLFCHGCNTELEAQRDPDDTNDQWRVRCCGEEAFGNSIAELDINWNQWRSRFFRDFRDA